MSSYVDNFEALSYSKCQVHIVLLATWFRQRASLEQARGWPEKADQCQATAEQLERIASELEPLVSGQPQEPADDQTRS